MRINKQIIFLAIACLFIYLLSWKAEADDKRDMTAEIETVIQRVYPRPTDDVGRARYDLQLGELVRSAGALRGVREIDDELGAEFVRAINPIVERAGILPVAAMLLQMPPQDDLLQQALWRQILDYRGYSIDHLPLLTELYLFAVNEMPLTFPSERRWATKILIATRLGEKVIVPILTSARGDHFARIGNAPHRWYTELLSNALERTDDPRHRTIILGCLTRMRHEIPAPEVTILGEPVEREKSE